MEQKIEKIALQMPNSYEPKVWGSHFWMSLYASVFAYPNNPAPETRQQYKNFLSALGAVIPCETCRKHFSKYLKENPIMDRNLESKSTLILWLFNANNAVNENMGLNLLTFDGFVEKYLKKFVDIEVTSETKNQPINSPTIMATPVRKSFAFTRKKIESPNNQTQIIKKTFNNTPQKVVNTLVKRRSCNCNRH